ncbi:MAG: type II toxin-antitoxin system HicA family toxin [Candidatus Gracilibacteria bacterium]|nr:type II toxin-antitoxin system HicA family toxin [Candidatus Gracilibacteria bacterium]
MTKREKIIEKLLNNPNSLKLSEIEILLFDLGFIFIEGKGSHRKITHKEKGIVYTYPVHGNDTLPIYKQRISKMFKRYFNN